MENDFSKIKNPKFSALRAFDYIGQSLAEIPIINGNVTGKKLCFGPHFATDFFRFGSI